MEPSKIKRDLKHENIHGLGKTSVSWHKDSGLQDFSSIAVYHSLQDINGKGGSEADEMVVAWKVALRVADTSMRIPALSIPLPSGSLYYLLDDFNHQHEHAVISGSDSLRYSSTHRVARDGAGTWQYIREKCKTVLSSSICEEILNALKESRQPSYAKFESISQRKILVKEVRMCHFLMTELEFEWVRQWYIQGRNHNELHYYWNKPIAYLEEVLMKIYNVICHVNMILKLSSTSKIDVVNEDLFDVTIEALENRNKLKLAWELRLSDSIFRTLKSHQRPLTCETLKKLDFVESSIVRKWRKAFVSRDNESDEIQSKDRKRKSKDNSSCLTKREKKRVASNWEKLKQKL
jgi:alpha-ketoglutarate-dependent dioxygenase FTO